MITCISLMLTLIALYGTYLNVNQHKKCFVWWIVSNSGWSVYNLCAGEYSLAFLFFVYLVLAIKGLKTWN